MLPTTSILPTLRSSLWRHSRIYGSVTVKSLAAWRPVVSRPLHYRTTRALRSDESARTRQYIPEGLSPPENPRSTENTRPTEIPKSTVISELNRAIELGDYHLSFTCKPCGARSTHKVSKQGYHKGSVLIACPECRNRHIISDHLKIFTETGTTLEDLMRERGQLVRKGSLSDDGDLEFWEDGSVTPHEKLEDGQSGSEKK